MSGCTFLEIDGEYINPDNISKFNSHGKEHVRISFKSLSDFIIVKVSIDEFKNMLRESNYFIKNEYKNHKS